MPKLKVCIAVGYNGSHFIGSQKQNGTHKARTVEGDLETAMFECGMIDPRNYGDIKKIRFSRASWTDKRVHALLNYFACKVHIEREWGLEDYKKKLNEACPKDMHVFSLIEVNKHFDAKASTNFREYDYYLPSFML